MQWNLAHRPRGVDTHVEIVLEAASSADAIEKLRTDIPAGDLILYVRKLG